MEIVGIWTGQSANALRMALRMTNEAFARHLGTAVRTVAKWGAQPEVVPVSELQRALDTALARASAEEQARFALLSPGVQSQRPIKADVPQQSILDSAGVEPRLTHDSAINDALHWLDSHMGWPDGEARGRVRSTLRTLNEDAIESLSRRRGNVGQTDIARALRAYYDATELTQYRFYEGLCDGARFATSVLLNPEWAGLRITLGRGNDHMALSPNTSTPDRYRLDEHAGDAAIRRLAETLTVGTRLLNAPLYRLLTVDISPNGIRGEVGVTSFVVSIRKSCGGDGLGGGLSGRAETRGSWCVICGC